MNAIYTFAYAAVLCVVIPFAIGWLEVNYRLGRRLRNWIRAAMGMSV